MSYNKEVKSILGSDVVDEILHNVQNGAITKIKMGEVAKALHPESYVFGDHQRRMDEGKAADQIEFKNILSDWYCKGLCEEIKDPNNVTPEERDEALMILITSFDELELNFAPSKKED